MRYKPGAAALLASAIVLTGPEATQASNLVYKPLNPSFGGNPNTAAWYFELAGAQKGKTGGGSGGGGGGGVNFGGGIGGPVIIINPGDTNVGGPDVDVDPSEEDVP